MILIHATKKLAAKLPPKLRHPSIDIPSSNPLSGWHGNLLNLQRRNCVLLVHDETRFALFMIGVRKPDFERFDHYFEDALINTLIKLGAESAQINAAQQLLGPCKFDTACNRSVQGTMNQMAGNIEHMLWYEDARLEDINPYRTAVWLADRPCNIKGQKDCVWPRKAMLALLSDQHDILKRGGSGDNVIQLDSYRRQSS
ncbi:MAG: hypothetical protein OIF35_07790 [Cellvibrionaceae bacterium]|nr:hypothetical protein [Cellvibrionaceae bacterium]MCV6627741.1 hypothetical protein [Cellvibrionaceae bacterium]